MQMTKLLLLASLWLLPRSMPSAADAPPARTPNIVMILADDKY